MKQHIPNLVTLLNLFAGSIAVIFAVQGHLVYASLFVGIGIIFDFLDGLLARLLDARSELGLQLDSLADVVTSGLVPGIVMFKLLAMSLNVSDEIIDAGHWEHQNSSGLGLINLLPFVGLLITLASAYRLAKFNIDAEQQHYFKGLPTPANAILILSLPLILEFQDSDLINAQILNPYTLITLTIISVYLLNSNVKLFALKFKSFDFASNATRYVFLILCVILLFVLKFAAIPIIMILYIAMSVLDEVANKKHQQPS